MLDVTRGTVFRVSLDPLAPGEFAGLSFVEPEGAFVGAGGTGYDLSGARRVEFDVASLASARCQFGDAGIVAPFEQVEGGGAFQHRVIDLASLERAPGSTLTCPPKDLTDVHVLFTVVSNDVNAPDGATVFLDNVQFIPTPSRQRSAEAA